MTIRALVAVRLAATPGPYPASREAEARAHYGLTPTGSTGGRGAADGDREVAEVAGEAGGGEVTA
ncbi:MAG: hypothetical protein V9G04_08800 [Nocardioides sp.]|jgi:hypothetical protein